MMAINIGEGPLGFTTAAIVQGITYATMMREDYGINVVVSNNSWGGYTPTAAIETAFAAQTAADILLVASAGNDDQNNDALPHYPSDYDNPGIVSVAASDQFDLRASYSNYGIASADLFAPGGDGTTNSLETIWSTWPPAVPDPGTGAVGSAYAGIVGTSMAQSARGGCRCPVAWVGNGDDCPGYQAVDDGHGRRLSLAGAVCRIRWPPEFEQCGRANPLDANPGYGLA